MSGPKLTREDAVEIKAYVYDLEDAVYVLLERRKMGQSVYLVYNGVKLYSCDVTLESAYREINEKRLERISIFGERGSKVMYPDRMREWEREVMYNEHHRRDIEDVLEICEALETKSFEECKKIYERRGYFGITFMIARFSKCGPEFVSYLSDKMLSKRVLDSFKELIERNDKSEKRNPSGIRKLHEEEMKTERKKMEEAISGYKRRKETYERELDIYPAENIQGLIDRGRAIVMPEKADQWEEFVRSKNLSIVGDATDFIYLTLLQALYVMESLKDGVPEDIVSDLFNELTDDFSAEIAVGIPVFRFAEKGPEFIKNYCHVQIESSLDEAVTKENERIMEARREKAGFSLSDFDKVARENGTSQPGSE